MRPKKQKSRRASVIMEHRATEAVLCANHGCHTEQHPQVLFLSPRPNLENLLHPCFFLFCVPFANPSSFCPCLGGNGREILFHFKTIRSQEQGERSRPLLACCCCPLPPQFYNLCVGAIQLHAIFHALVGTSPILNNFLILPSCSSSFWKASSFLMSENLTLHFFLLAFSFAP